MPLAEKPVRIEGKTQSAGLMRDGSALNGLLLWTRRVSNPRPNRDALSFLHAYLCLSFSGQARTRATAQGLIL